MTFLDVMTAAGISKSEAEYVLWNRTPFPFDPRPRTLYKCASGFRRASANGIKLCNFCHRPATIEGWAVDICKTCDDAMSAAQ